MLHTRVSTQLSIALFVSEKLVRARPGSVASEGISSRGRDALLIKVRSIFNSRQSQPLIVQSSVEFSVKRNLATKISFPCATDFWIAMTVYVKFRTEMTASMFMYRIDHEHVGKLTLIEAYSASCELESPIDRSSSNIEQQSRFLNMLTCLSGAQCRKTSCSEGGGRVSEELCCC